MRCSTVGNVKDLHTLLLMISLPLLTHCVNTCFSERLYEWYVYNRAMSVTPSSGQQSLTYWHSVNLKSAERKLLCRSLSTACKGVALKIDQLTWSRIGHWLYESADRERRECRGHVLELRYNQPVDGSSGAPNGSSHGFDNVPNEASYIVWSVNNARATVIRLVKRLVVQVLKVIQVIGLVVQVIYVIQVVRLVVQVELHRSRCTSVRDDIFDEICLESGQQYILILCEQMEVKAIKNLFYLS